MQVGDVVALKSGGLPMTVEKSEGDYVHCIWLSVNGTLQEAEIPIACLSPVVVGIEATPGNPVPRS